MEDNNINVNKKLSNEKLRERFSKLAVEIADIFISFSELREKAHEIIDVGTKLGMDGKQIKEVVYGLTKGRVSERTIARYLGDVGKDQYMKALADRSHDRRQRSASEQSANNNKIIEVKPEELSIEEKKFLITTFPKGQIKVKEPEPSQPQQYQAKSHIVKQIFDPTQADRNERSHVFILYIDLADGHIVKYETIGRRLVQAGWK